MPSLCIVVSCALFMFVSNDNHCQAYRSLKACFKTEWKTTLHRKLLKSKRSYAGWFGVLSKLENQIQFTGNNRIFVRKVTPKEAMINQKKPKDGWGWRRKNWLQMAIYKKSRQVFQVTPTAITTKSTEAENSRNQALENYPTLCRLREKARNLWDEPIVKIN